MQLNLGETIRQLRARDKRTQEALATALGVTAQAVSRWEAGGSYPDMELVPAIANYFGISIDELFGYRSHRDACVDAIIQRVHAFNIKSRSDDEWIDDCLSILREGLAEFPQNERLLITLADALSEAGWRRHQEWLSYDDAGFIQHNYDVHRENPYWKESIQISEQLASHAHDSQIVTRALHILVLLYRNIGERDKAIACANKMPGMDNCRELLLAAATDGQTAVRYIGEFLIRAAHHVSQQIVYGLIANRKHFDSDLPIVKIKGAIALFEMICDDGNMGLCYDDLICLNLFLSRVQWERGYHDEAFATLDEALRHARALENLLDGNAHTLTAPLVSLVKYSTRKTGDIVKSLPDDWPWWHNPDYSQVEIEMKADPRWAEWVAKTQL